MRRASPPRVRPGLTIIELLVSIAVVAVLFSIALPALRGARKSAERANRLSTLRGLLQATYTYANDSAGTFPYFGNAGDPVAPVEIDGWRPASPHSYFGAHRVCWISLLDPEYYDAMRDETVNLSIDPGSRQDDQPEHIIRSLFWLTDTASADPRYWEGLDPIPDLYLFRGTKTSEVTSPSGKGLVLDALFEVIGEDTHALVGMADGSASRRLWGVGDEDNVVQRPWGAIAWEVMSTRNGLKGRDF